MGIETLSNAAYWERRAAAVLEAAEYTALKKLQRLQSVFRDAERAVEKEILAQTAKYEAEGFTMAELNKLLPRGEFSNAAKEIRHYYAEVRRVGGYSPGYERYLRALSFRSRMTRFEELKLQIQKNIEELYRRVHRELSEGLRKAYTDAYYRTVYDFQHGTGLFADFTALSQDTIDRAITERWLGDNFSGRVWAQKDVLLKSLNTTFLRGVALGRNPRVIAREMAGDVADSYDRTTARNCVRLARTEFNHIANQAAAEACKQTGVVKEYQFIATLDKKTSKPCQEMDLKHFPYSEAATGVNFPPLHPNCRSTTKPYFPPDEVDKLFGAAKRAARDPATGKTYYVPADWTYEQWRESLTEEQGRYVLTEKAVKKAGKVLTDSPKRGILNTEGKPLRVDTGGLRNENPLTVEQVSAVKDYAKVLGMDSAKIIHMDWMHTAYSKAFDEMIIGTDVIPSANPTTANSGLSMKATVAHEIVGHRDAALKGWTQPKDYILPDHTTEEIQASVRAARFAPDLTDTERWRLLRDAIERLPAGFHIRDIKDMIHITER